jgi:uncharacterized membrane protein YhaH (DUF805 family)
VRGPFDAPRGAAALKEGFVSWYITVLQKYFVLDGRARRMEYWMFALVNSVIGLALVFVEAVVTGEIPEEGSTLSTAYSLVVLIPSITVGVRRLHDTGRSGWWLLIALIPILGAIVLLVFMVLDGDAGPNEYGPDPKALAHPS